MKIYCPHCSAKLEAEDDMAGQVVQCPVCQKDIQIVQSAETTSRLVCEGCGTELLPGAKFCGKCGSKVKGKAVGVRDSQKNKTPKKIETLTKAIWATIWLYILACIIGLFDVREYYEYGRFGHILGSAGLVALNIWLANKIVERKNWARVTYISFSLLVIVLALFGFLSPEESNGLCSFINLGNLIITLYCVVSLFKEQSARCFDRSENGVVSAFAFWGAFVGLLFFMGVYTNNHQSQESYLEDCADAAIRGSSEAYAALVEYAIANGNFYGSMDEIYAAALQNVDNYLIERSRSENVQPIKKENPKKSNEKIDWSKFSKYWIFLIGLGSALINKLRESFRK